MKKNEGTQTDIYSTLTKVFAIECCLAEHLC